jgi:hypothetical protein
MMAEQRVSLITLGSQNLAASKHFYCEGFGWSTVFENEEIIFYQLNGLVLAIFANAALADDMQRATSGHYGNFALAHNVRGRDEVETLMRALLAAGGKLLRAADEPPIGGLRGYVADPDGHAWEIAFNPGFAIDSAGNIQFGI